LEAALKAQKIELSQHGAAATDPEHVLVLELAARVADLRKAVERIPGLEFLAEYLGEEVAPDDDFSYKDEDGNRTDTPIRQVIYAVLSNAEAARNLVSLFNSWQSNPNFTFPRGQTRWRDAFQLLRTVRRWSVQDRIEETGLLDDWKDTLAAVGGAQNSVQVEIELWFRAKSGTRRKAEISAATLVADHGGRVLSSCLIPQIKYHAMLAELPIQVAEKAVKDGLGTVNLLVSDQIMFVSPHRPMTVETPEMTDLMLSEDRANSVSPLTAGSLPRVALLDGLPMGNHALLAGRLIIDDPDDSEPVYQVLARSHGTAMASLIIHGDISTAREPLDRPVYVRPIMRPREFGKGEEVQPGILMTDLLHRAVRRIVEGEGTQQASAPSVRIINLSVGHPARGTVRTMSSLGRLVDWLAVKYNLLFVVSAGNYEPHVEIKESDLADPRLIQDKGFKWYVESSRARGVLPPGDAMNALTVGAVHKDDSSDLRRFGHIVDATPEGYPALYSATGPGVSRSIKPDILFGGGRQVFFRPIFQPGQDRAELQAARADATGPGNLVAQPGPAGDVRRVAYLAGTSNAAALVTREASELFDLLERMPGSGEGYPPPDPVFHPLLVRGLLVHAASWGKARRSLEERLVHLSQPKTRANIGHLLGYGILDPRRAKSSTPSRAAMVGWGRIRQDQEVRFHIPLPPSLHAKAEWHRVAITLASFPPVVGGLSRYRAARVVFQLDGNQTVGGSVEADSRPASRGSVQHLVFEGRKALTITPGTELPVRIQCLKDARDLRPDEAIMFALVVTVETEADVSTTIFDEIQDALVIQARSQVRGRLQV
jgi:hypothetical protein